MERTTLENAQEKMKKSFDQNTPFIMNKIWGNQTIIMEKKDNLVTLTMEGDTNSKGGFPEEKARNKIDHFIKIGLIDCIIGSAVEIVDADKNK